MQAHTRQTLRLSGSAALVFVFVWFAALAFADLLSFTQASRFDVIELAADSNLWGWIFGIITLLLVIALVRKPRQPSFFMSRVCSAAAAFLGAWAFFTLMWGLTTEYPVSLAVFGPAVFTVVGAQVLAVSWRHSDGGHADGVPARRDDRQRHPHRGRRSAVVHRQPELGEEP